MLLYHITIINSRQKMTPVYALNRPEKVRYSFSFMNIKPQLKVGDYARNADKRNNFWKGYISSWDTELFEINQVLKTQSPTYRIDDIDGEII